MSKLDKITKDRKIKTWKTVDIDVILENYLKFPDCSVVSLKG